MLIYDFYQFQNILYIKRIQKLAILTLSVYGKPLRAISLKNASAKWIFCCSPTNVFVMCFSGYDVIRQGFLLFLLFYQSDTCNFCHVTFHCNL